MILKERIESEELLVWRQLNKRLNLPDKERQHYMNLEKGYRGEADFDLLLKSLEEEKYIINDLLLEVNNSYFQIDSIIISQGVVYLIDIKNFQGDYYFDSNRLYTLSTSKEIKNPVDQLKRSTTLFHQLLHTQKLNYLVEAYVIFINPEFTLYQTPKESPIIFPSQLERFLKKLNKTTSKLNDSHKRLAQTLLSLHQTKNPFSLQPKYTYDQLQKGIYCNGCNSFTLNIKYKNFVCGQCGAQEKIELAILRSIEEFKLLFPERKITTRNIYEWCQVELHKRTIARVLKKYFKVQGSTSDTHYI
ncbi:nuclease-related domain-containing protein [Cytobacillus sp. FJAT-54145]|uniref:Nuclease-related domain-containing protein n=1 Tax=Cytobacillus spartinae TaxID=3299023 RepID=A0ABW6KB18_9BACI